MLILFVFSCIFAPEIVPNTQLITNYFMKFKSDFRFRLIRLQQAIEYCLELDDNSALSDRCILFPCLYSVLSCLWCDKSKVFKNVSKSI